ncbi:hypothetical protein L0F63_003869, partial [Massospora cicadina]
SPLEPARHPLSLPLSYVLLPSTRFLHLGFIQINPSSPNPPLYPRLHWHRFINND